MSGNNPYREDERTLLAAKYAHGLFLLHAPISSEVDRTSTAITAKPTVNVSSAIKEYMRTRSKFTDSQFDAGVQFGLEMALQEALTAEIR